MVIFKHIKPYKGSKLSLTLMKKHLKYGALFTFFIVAYTLTINTSSATKTFSDVPVTHPNYEAIMYLEARGIINGHPDGTFRPQDIVNRAEALKIILGGIGIGIDIDNDGTNSIFPDVKKSDWFAPYVTTATRLKIINGYPDGTFKPGQTLNLAENLKILVLGVDIDVNKIFVTESPYADVSPHDWFGRYFVFAKATNLIDADNQNKAYPGQGMTRGSLAEAMYRLLSQNNLGSSNDGYVDNLVYDVNKNFYFNDDNDINTDFWYDLSQKDSGDTGSNTPPPSPPPSNPPQPPPPPGNPPQPPPPTDTGAGIAASYPGDVNIDQDPNVIFTEMGEESSTTELFSHWSNNSGTSTIALDSSTYPSNSPGHQSIKLSTTGGIDPIAILYKSFPSGYDDTIYARWYVKYNTNGTFHHSGIRLGGTNPPSSKNPNSPAGTKPDGTDFFYMGAEVTQEKVATSTFDFYNYWPGMKTTSFFPGKYYGNSFINDSNVTINLNEWTCIEVRLKLNNPLSSTNGEISMWINGQQVSDVKAGTIGTWQEDNFFPGSGTAFDGFQWRTDPNLMINYFSLSHFVDQDPQGHVNSIYFDHVVVAKSYIGPIQ